MEKEKPKVFTVHGLQEKNLRLDKFLTGCRLPFSRSRIQKLIAEEKILVNGSPSQGKHRLHPGDEVFLLVASDDQPQTQKIISENIPLTILYEDDDLMLIDKPAGMVVHPAAGHYSGTLVNALLFYTPHLSTLNGSLRPGIVHRLDKDTSGILVVAKTDQAHLYLSQEIKKQKCSRKYLALVHGDMELNKGTVEIPLGRHSVDRKKFAVRHQGGKLAITHYRVLERFGTATFLEVTLTTGRTHQIRVHLTHLGHPIVGDETYGRKISRSHPELSALINRQALHACTLGFIHPSRKEYMQFDSPLPKDMEKVLKVLRGCE